MAGISAMAAAPESYSIFAIAIIPLIVWEAVWKGFGLWHSARNGRTIWFIAILIFNTLGILPIVYLLINRKKKDKPANSVAESSPARPQ